MSAKIEHDYHDFAGVVEGDEVDRELLKLHHVDAKHKRSSSAFPLRLHYMLKEMEADGLSDIMSWQEHGRSFRVHDRDRFTKEVLPL